jgi:hypothetical protein
VIYLDNRRSVYRTCYAAGGELLPSWRVTHHAGYAAVIGTGRQSSFSPSWRPTLAAMDAVARQPYALPAV